MAIASIRERYKYLDLLYGCMFGVSKRGDFGVGVAKTCFDPLLFHYPELDEAFEDIEDTFIYADALKISPVLKKRENDTHYEVFFPTGNWLDMNSYEGLKVDEPKKIKLTYPISTANAHLMPGKLIGIVDNVDKVLTVNDVLDKPLTLIVNADEAGQARGKIFMTYSDSQKDLDTGGFFEHYELRLSGNSLFRFDLNAHSAFNY